MKSMTNKNFFRALYEGYYGNDDCRYDWRRYLACVYIANNGKVEQFDIERSVNKFKTINCRMPIEKYREIVKSNPSLYAKYLMECDHYLRSQSSRYVAIYGR